MIKATRVGHTIVCFINNKMYQKTFLDEKELISNYELILNTSDEDPEEVANLKAIFEVPKTSEELKKEKEAKDLQDSIEERKDLIQWMEDIKNLGDEHFEVKGISLYMKGISISVPEFLAKEFAKRRENEEDLKSLINFWRLLALNPDPRCREDLYKFLINNHMVVTPSGYFLAYRNANVKKSSENRELEEFINAQIIKIKGWKKSPNKYSVLELIEDAENKNAEKYLIKENTLISKWFSKGNEHYRTIGNLQEMYDKIDTNSLNKTIYTDAHSGSTTIIIGQPVSIDRSECDADPDRTCSKGLHLGSTNFMSKGYFGSVGLICLCNPMHVVAVPYTDGQKLRTSEYLPIGIAEYDGEGKIIPIESDTFEYDYAEHTEEQIEKMLAKTRFESLKEHQILPLEITKEALKNILEGVTASIEDMKKVINNRVNKV